MARRRSRELNDADFAAAVIELYKAAVCGKLDKVSGNQDREVREVAFALTTMRQLLDRELKADNALQPGKPILGGLTIIDALTSGRDHPIWRHIKGLKSRRFRTQNAPPNRGEDLGRVVVVGLVRAYQQTANASQRAAIQAVVEACRFNDFAFGAEQIKRWDRTFREQQEPGPDAFANKFMDDAKSLSDAIQAGDERAKNYGWFARLDAAARVLAVGQTCVWRMWAVAGATGDI